MSLAGKNVSSSSAQSGAARMVSCAASTGGVIAFTQALAMEVAPNGVTVNNEEAGYIIGLTLSVNGRRYVI